MKGGRDMTPFLETLVHLSLAGSLLGLTVWAATRLLKSRLSKAGAYVLWLLVLLRLLLPLGLPGASPLLWELPMSAPAAEPAPPSVQSEAPAAVSEADPNLPPVQSGAPAAFFEGDPARPSLLPWVWGAGALLTLAIPLVAYGHFLCRVRRDRLPPQPGDQALLKDLCPRHAPDLWCCPGLPTPMLVGLFHPAILLPEESYEGREEVLAHILLHELTHYRRWDILVKWLSALARALHWFNPLVHLLCRQLNRACELACDEGAVRGMTAPERKAYSYTLLSLASAQEHPLPLTTALAQDKKAVKERLLSVLGSKPLTRRAVLLTLALILTAAAWALALGPVRTQLSASRDPWLAASAQAYLSSQEVQALEEAYNRGCEEFTLYTSLPLQDGTYPEPWPIRLAYYQTQWTAGSPYVLWDITRQPVANARLGQHWMTVEEWRYRGLLRATTLTDLRTQAVLTGASPSPSFVGSMSTIDPHCMTARGIAVGDSLENLTAAYPEAHLHYTRTDKSDSETIRSRGLVDHDACWRFAPEDDPDSQATHRTIFFLVKEGRVVQIDLASESDGNPWGLGYYLSDWAYTAGYLP